MKEKEKMEGVCVCLREIGKERENKKERERGRGKKERVSERDKNNMMKRDRK